MAAPAQIPTRSPRRPPRRSPRRLREWALLVAAVVLISLTVRTFVFQAFWIPTESMVPTLAKGDRVMVNKLAYRLGDIERGDIVVFENPDPTADGPVHLVKRVIGLGGETVEGIEGAIHVDGHRLDEPYLSASSISRTFDAVVVPEGDLFVLGDNRLASSDSSAGLGTVPADSVVGRVVARFWPPTRIGLP